MPPLQLLLGLGGLGVDRHLSIQPLHAIPASLDSAAAISGAVSSSSLPAIPRFMPPAAPCCSCLLHIQVQRHQHGRRV